LLAAENEEQIEYFCKEYKLDLMGNKFFQSLPQTGGMDGFFSAILVRRSV
jgi:16S rRNA C967 or C1407 C5-methylase (RsmB/RsmF family)